MLCKAAYDVVTHNGSRRDITESSSENYCYDTGWWCQYQPYVLYQTRVYNMASQPPSVQGYSLLSLFDMCLLLLPLEDSLLCTILIYATAHSATTTKTARLTERRRNYETHISAAGHVLVL